MKLFQLSFSTLILRFYLLMAIVIGAFFLGVPALAFLALPLFISAMMGMKFSVTRSTRSVASSAARSYNVPGRTKHQTAH